MYMWYIDTNAQMFRRILPFLLQHVTSLCLLHLSFFLFYLIGTLRWRHNGRDSVSNHQPYDCLLNRLFRRRWKKTSKLRVTGLCVGNSPGTGEFPAQMASDVENVSIWWRHHGMDIKWIYLYLVCFGVHLKWTLTSPILHKMAMNWFTRPRIDSILI